jgi:hypothetical protein
MYTRNDIVLIVKCQRAAGMASSVAQFVALVRADGRNGLALNTGADKSLPGNGNRAWRRQGGEITQGCSCVVCEVYGGDCSYVMREEWRREEHLARRGVKTRLARRLRSGQSAS